MKAFAAQRLKAIRTNKGLSHAEQDFIPAKWYAYAGDSEIAIVELRIMVKNHSQNALQIADDPAYKNLRSDPRFIELLKEIGVPAEASTPA